MVLPVLIAASACRSPDRPLPDWGRARLTVSGPDAIAVERVPGGVTCTAGAVTVRSPGGGPFWALTVRSAPPSVWWSRRDRREDAIQPGPTWVARDPAGLALGDGRVDLDEVVLQPEGGGEAVTIDGSVRCPIAADPVPQAAVEALAAAAGAAATRVGERARVEVDPERLGAVVDGTRGRLRSGGVVVYAGRLDGGRGEVWVAPGSGAVDIVRHARVAGPDAPWVAATVERLVREHRIDVIAADPTSLTARLPEPVDAAALAREVAALCPAILHARDASIEALRLQLARDRQLVCWWEG